MSKYPMHFYLRLIFIGLLMSFAGCSSVSTTVDSFGDAGLDRARSLCFLTEGVSLEAKQVVLECQRAAGDLGLKISALSCADCVSVKVIGRMGPPQTFTGTYLTQQESTSWGSFSSLNGGSGVFNATTTTPVNQTYSYNEYERSIRIGFFTDKNLKSEIRAIHARSSGVTDSLARVTYEICTAAFKDFPKNLKGKKYEIKMESK